jgi:hypothetical protein
MIPGFFSIFLLDDSLNDKFFSSKVNPDLILLTQELGKYGAYGGKAGRRASQLHRRLSGLAGSKPKTVARRQKLFCCFSA